jgi:hypothetical protein
MESTTPIDGADRRRDPRDLTGGGDARQRNGIGGMSVRPEQRGNGDGDGDDVVAVGNGGKERMDPVGKRQSRSPSFELIEQTPRSFVVSVTVSFLFLLFFEGADGVLENNADERTHDRQPIGII